MSVRIRLARYGTNNRPCYRIVAADSRARRDGRFIELLGSYDPLKEPAAVTLKEERIKYWLSKGAKASETVASILKKHMKR